MGVRFRKTGRPEKCGLKMKILWFSGPVRHIFTPAGGTKVTSLEQLESEREYVVGAGPQNFRKVSDILKHLEPSPKSKKKNSVSSNYSNYSDSSQVSRMTLIERQNLIAQKGREDKEKRTASNNSLNRYKPEPDPVPLSPLEKRFQKKFGNARKGRGKWNLYILYSCYHFRFRFFISGLLDLGLHYDILWDVAGVGIGATVVVAILCSCRNKMEKNHDIQVFLMPSENPFQFNQTDVCLLLNDI